MEEIEAPLSFSPKELEVIRLLARGLNQREIKEEMGISYRTVQEYTNTARGKLRVKHARQLPIAYQEATGNSPWPS